MLEPHGFGLRPIPPKEIFPLETFSLSAFLPVALFRPLRPAAVGLNKVRVAAATLA
jgi:hypothetical protein